MAADTEGNKDKEQTDRRQHQEEAGKEALSKAELESQEWQVDSGVGSITMSRVDTGTTSPARTSYTLEEMTAARAEGFDDGMDKALTDREKMYDDMFKQEAEQSTALYRIAIEENERGRALYAASITDQEKKRKSREHTAWCNTLNCAMNMAIAIGVLAVAIAVFLS